jgi:AbrB family looped-hinge helix DNA binding protein
MDRSLISTKGRVTIPVRLRKRFGIKPGTRIKWMEERGRLVLTPVLKTERGRERRREKS